jgi:hypothetical protein
MNSSNRAKCLELIPSYFSTIYTDINDLWNKFQEIIKTKIKNLPEPQTRIGKRLTSIFMLAIFLNLINRLAVDLLFL